MSDLDKINSTPSLLEQLEQERERGEKALEDQKKKIPRRIWSNFI